MLRDVQDRLLGLGLFESIVINVDPSADDQPYPFAALWDAGDVSNMALVALSEDSLMAALPSLPKAAAAGAPVAAQAAGVSDTEPESGDSDAPKAAKPKKADAIAACKEPAAGAGVEKEAGKPKGIALPGARR